MVKDILELPNGRLDFRAGCLLMGILNVTDDSFSDGGEFIDTEKAIAHGLEMQSDGAAIIDVGAESTRPGSAEVTAAEQIRRAIPVIKALRQKLTIPISIDTRSFEVAAVALDAGASIINDITALDDARTAALAAMNGSAVILMHMQGKPATMQKNPQYKDVVAEVLAFLIERAKQAEQSGIAKEKIFIDPGIGFGKKPEHNIALLKNLDKFTATGYRVLVGASRKKFIGDLTGKENPADRDWGTAATVALSAAAGVSIVRVHNVGAMSDVVKIANAITRRAV